MPLPRTGEWTEQQSITDAHIHLWIRHVHREQI